MPAQIDDSLLDHRLSELEKAPPWSPRLVSKLETFIRTADDYDLFRVNPLQYGAARGLAEAEAIDLFIYAAKVGLFEMDWPAGRFSAMRSWPPLSSRGTAWRRPSRMKST